MIPKDEYEATLLELSPLDITLRYLRKCIGRQSNQIEKSNREFCRSATFELTLGLNKYPTSCKCNARGSHPFTNCNPQNGQCSCKQGYRGKDCSKCVQGLFPHCRARSRMFRYSYFLWEARWWFLMKKDTFPTVYMVCEWSCNAKECVIGVIHESLIRVYPPFQCYCCFQTGGHVW